MSTGRYTPPRAKTKVHALTEMSTADAAERLAACDCPATITVSGALTTIEHVHHRQCPVLVAWKKANR